MLIRVDKASLFNLYTVISGKKPKKRHMPHLFHGLKLVSNNQAQKFIVTILHSIILLEKRIRFTKVSSKSQFQNFYQKTALFDESFFKFCQQFNIVKVTKSQKIFAFFTHFQNYARNHSPSTFFQLPIKKKVGTQGFHAFYFYENKSKMRIAF